MAREMIGKDEGMAIGVVRSMLWTGITLLTLFLAALITSLYLLLR